MISAIESLKPAAKYDSRKGVLHCVPRAASVQTSGSFTYTVGAGNVVPITTSNLSGSVLAGPAAGVTFTVDQIVTAGYPSTDGSTPTPAAGTSPARGGDGTQFWRLPISDETQ